MQIIKPPAFLTVNYELTDNLNWLAMLEQIEDCAVERDTYQEAQFELRTLLESIESYARWGFEIVELSNVHSFHKPSQLHRLTQVRELWLPITSLLSKTAQLDQ